MTGGGFGGCVLALIEDGEADRVGAEVRDAYAHAGFDPPTWFVATPSEGARRL